jgi:hypothetical protein
VVIDWLELAKFLVMAAAGLLLWTHRHAFLGGELIGRLKTTEHEIVALRRRMDTAGEEMSNLANEVQALPDRWRAECIPRREFALTLDKLSEAVTRHEKGYGELTSLVHKIPSMEMVEQLLMDRVKRLEERQRR